MGMVRCPRVLGLAPGGTVALRRRASSPCLKVGTQAPQTPWRTVTNRAFECLLRGFWAGEWITSGDPNAQCNSAHWAPLRRAIEASADQLRWRADLERWARDWDNS